MILKRVTYNKVNGKIEKNVDIVYNFNKQFEMLPQYIEDVCQPDPDEPAILQKDELVDMIDNFKEELEKSDNELLAELKDYDLLIVDVQLLRKWIRQLVLVCESQVSDIKNTAKENQTVEFQYIF